MVLADIKADVKQQEIKKIVLAVSITSLRDTYSQTLKYSVKQAFILDLI